MRNKLISSLAGAAFSFAASGLAFAADLNKPVYKAPPPPAPAPVYTWTGWYVGGNVGYGWGDAKTDLTTNGITSAIVGCAPGECLPLALTTVTTGFASAASNTAHPNGVIGGGQMGYNYQFSPNGVLGFEADFQGSGERGSGQFTDPFVATFCTFAAAPGVCSSLPGSTTPVPGTVLTSYQAKIDWFGTVRGRLGWLVNDQLLIYGTGGLAYGKVAVSGNANIGVAAIGTAFTTTAGFGASKTNVGFSVGGGIEGRLSYWLPPNWTWKLEYLYLDLGSIDTTTPFVVLTTNFISAGSNVAGNISTHTHFTDNIVRVGLNYQFH